MSNLAASSVSKTASGVIDDLRSAWKGLDPRFIVYFASPAIDPSALAAEIKTAFPAAVHFGCTSAGEIVSGRMLKGGVAALALPGELAGTPAVELATSVRARPEGVLAALDRLAARFDRPARALDHARHLGLVLIDGLSQAEERVMDLLGNACDVRFVGGSAGDDLQFRATHVAVDGQAVTDAVALALLNPPRGFDLIKTQSFRALPARLVATKVDEANRTVLEFNGHPAASAYAAALSVPLPDLTKHFLRHPLGLMVDADPFVRSPMRLEGDGVRFYCDIKQGMELALLESADIVGDTAAAIAAQRAKGEIAALINFNCILRTLELEDRGQTGAYGEVFSAVPTVGFSTYGEELIGHMNQTATMVSFRAG
jgi:hypothetical protein